MCSIHSLVEWWVHNLVTVIQGSIFHLDLDDAGSWKEPNLKSYILDAISESLNPQLNIMAKIIERLRGSGVNLFLSSIKQKN